MEKYFKNGKNTLKMKNHLIHKDYEHKTNYLIFDFLTI